ncbi:hypothetical protein ES708_18332 [subsurface metagenome]
MRKCRTCKEEIKNVEEKIVVFKEEENFFCYNCYFKLFSDEELLVIRVRKNDLEIWRKFQIDNGYEIFDKMISYSVNALVGGVFTTEDVAKKRWGNSVFDVSK